jgi:hypothetical protein
MPDERYFSMPSAEVGGDVRRNRALNCWPWVRSLTHSPEAVIHSPAAMVLSVVEGDPLDEAGEHFLGR